MYKKLPKISIVTPSYNQGAYLEKTIKSVLDQNYPNLEYIIIDGGSTDNSVEIIKKYADRLAFWVSEKDNGQSDAINKGLSCCTGEIIAWLNSDDYYEKDTLEKVAKTFSDFPDYEVIVGDCRIIQVDDKGNEINTFIARPGEVSQDSLMSYWVEGFVPPQPSMFWRKSLQDKTGLLSEELNFGMDLEFWLQFSKYSSFKKVNEILSNYLIHLESKSGSEGGFDKFIAEWEKIVDDFAKTLSASKRISFKLRKWKSSFITKSVGFKRKARRKLRKIKHKS